MIKLGADEAILSIFKVLCKQDVKASTTLMDPNVPGLTKVKLSWLWTTGSDTDQRRPEALVECMYVRISQIKLFNYIVV